MQGYLQEDPYAGHSHFSSHHDSYYNGGGDASYNGPYGSQEDQYIHVHNDKDGRNFPDNASDGAYNSRGDLHLGDGIHYPQHLQASLQDRSRTPSDYNAPIGSSGREGGGMGSSGDYQGGHMPAGYLGDEQERYPGSNSQLYGDQQENYYDEDSPRGRDYSPPSHPPYHYSQDGLHDDGHGQRDSYAGSRSSFQEPHHLESNYDEGPYREHDSHMNSGSYLDQQQQQQQLQAPRYNGGVYYPEDNYLDPVGLEQSYNQDHSSLPQDQASYHQDDYNYQDQPSLRQDQPSFHEDHPSFHQDQPSYHQDQQNLQNHDPNLDLYQRSYDPHSGQYSPVQYPEQEQSDSHPRLYDQNNQGPHHLSNEGHYDPANEQDRYSDAPRDRHSLNSLSRGSYHRDAMLSSSHLPDSSFHNDPRDHEDYMGPPPEQQGLPQVPADPFAEDPFQDQPQLEDPYYRGQGVPRSLPGGPDPYDDQAPPYDDRDAPDAYFQNAPRYPEDEARLYGQGDPYLEHDVSQRLDRLTLGQAHPNMRGPPSVHDERGMPNPDLQEVIDFLVSPDDTVKASAAAHLQHITFMDDTIKAKARSMGAFRPLISLLSHELCEVHKNACGALQNLSYGKNNTENKREIKNENGIPELIRLLRKTDQEDVKESVTGVLWNLSSAEDLKQPIIENGLSVLINSVILRYSGWSALGNASSQLPWTTVCRNTTGILRNVSSAGFDARKRMRECRGLVNALIYVLKLAAEDVDSNAIDNKVVENTVCVLRNLSYRIQEVVDPDFYKNRSLPRQQHGKQGGKGKTDNNAGCFGNKSSKARAAQSSKANNQPAGAPPQLPPASVEYRALWGSEIHSLYSTVLKRCTNSITMEAAAGAIQNLTACDWQPAVESRAMVRKEKGLPLLVDLLSAESDRVVCATATALRNLAIDEKNKELVGKYAIRQLVSRLPRDYRSNMPDDTICAVVATLYEVVKDNQDFALALVQEDGLPRLMHINTSEGHYLARTLKFTLTLLKTLWGFKSLQQEYLKLQYTQADFTTSRAYPRKDGSRPPGTSNTPSASNHTTPYNTLSRPMSGQGYDDSTLTSGGGMRYGQHLRPAYQDQNYQPLGQGYNHQDHLYGSQSRIPSSRDGNRGMGHTIPSRQDSREHHNYSRDRIPQEDIPLNDLSSGYAPLDEPRPHRTKPPVGGVPLFPSFSPVETSPSPYGGSVKSGPEPLYAQVNKSGQKRMDPSHHETGSGRGSPHDSLHRTLDGGGGGADSWV